MRVRNYRYIPSICLVPLPSKVHSTEAQGVPVEVNTLVRALKANGLVWKRTRHSLKKSYRDFPRSQVR